VNKHELIDQLRGLTDKQFVEFFYAAAAGRDVYAEEPATRSRLVLAAAVQGQDNQGWSAPQIQLLALPDAPEQWADDVPICQYSKSCGHEVASWAKGMRCPACHEKVYGT
jgi:hypothetical protein